MSEKKTSKAQRQASRNWEAKNRDQVRKQSYLRTARMYVKNYADNEDMQDLLYLYGKYNPNSNK